MKLTNNQEITVVSWNVHYPFFAKDNSYVIDTLEKLEKPDVICLQEYVEGAGDALLQWIEDNQYEYEYLPFAKFNGKSMGVLTAVKKTLHPIFQPITLRSDDPKLLRPFHNIRGVMSVLIKIGDSHVDIINVHLTYPRFHTIDMRKREFSALSSYLNRQHTGGIFLCGDFNFVPTDNRRRYLKRRFMSFSGNYLNKTWKHSLKYSPLRGNPDYLFWDKSRVRVTAELAEFSTSDHRALLAKIKPL